jgi:hypothetical protein
MELATTSSFNHWAHHILSHEPLRPSRVQHDQSSDDPIPGLVPPLSSRMDIRILDYIDASIHGTLVMWPYPSYTSKPKTSKIHKQPREVLPPTSWCHGSSSSFKIVVGSSGSIRHCRTQRSLVEKTVSILVLFLS